MRVRFGEFIVDTDTRQLLRDSAPVHLSPKGFQLLELLVTARPKAVSKEALYNQLWPETFVVEANLSNLVGELRAGFDDDPRHPRFVRTVHGFGYAFVAPEDASGVSQPAAVLYQLVWSGGRATFGEGEHVLGRDPALELCIDSSSVSRRHARLRIADGQAVLEDLGSKNGTFVNDKRLTAPVSLGDRDQLCIGSIRLTFRIRSPQLSTETIGTD